MLTGIDISGYQNNSIVDIIKDNSSIEFVIVKCGGSDADNYKDSMFDYFYKRIKNMNKKGIGVYFVTGLNDVSDDINLSLEYIKGKQFDMPIYLDVEMEYINKYINSGKSLESLNKYIYNYCISLEKRGYYVGIYSSAYFFKHYADKSLDRFAKWSAEYTSEQSVGAGMWQYGQEQFNKILLDVNKCYIDYSSIIKAKGLNGYSKDSSLNSQTLCLSEIQKEQTLAIFYEYLFNKMDIKEAKAKLTSIGIGPKKCAKILSNLKEEN